MPTLKSGLAMFIQEVEKLPPGTHFNMTLYDQCIIGKTLGFVEPASDNDNYDWATLEKYFGISSESLAKSGVFASLFASTSFVCYTEEQWEVISLFTGRVGEVISREHWLKMAKEQLEKMQ